MSRYKLLIEFDGRPFCGWQRQTNAISVQQAIEEAVTRFCGESPKVEGAGRTDAGVHATGMVAHVDIGKPTTCDVVRNALNAHLRPHPISIIDVQSVPEDFHARFSALWRSYTYVIVNRPSPLTLEQGLAWHIPQTLECAEMTEAAHILLGHHDFTTFRSAHCQAKSPLKTLDVLEVTQTDDNRIEIYVQARSFLHNQVRIMTGALVNVGMGRWSCADVSAALEAKDRQAGPMTAPPDGLYLTGVCYDEK